MTTSAPVAREERSCWTCRHDTTTKGGHGCRIWGADGTIDYLQASGAYDGENVLPTDRTLVCPGHAPKES